MEQSEMKGLKFKAPVGFIGDLTLQYRQRNDWTETLNSSTISLSIHGPHYIRPSLGPSFVSTPNEIGFPSELYRYEAKAVDTQQQTITYSLVSDESGISINSMTGLVQWNVAESQRDPILVTITAKNTSGQTATQEYWIKIANANQPPVFTTSPVVDAEVGRRYAYDFAAKDPDGDMMVFGVRAPLGWEIVDNRNGTGTLTRMVSSSDAVGPIKIFLDVSDRNGATTTQAFEIAVAPNNHAPVFTSTPKIRFELAGQDLSPLGDVRVIQPTGQANQKRLWFNLAKGDKVSANVRFSVSASPPKVDVMLLLDDTESFEGPNYLLSTRFLDVANKLRMDFPNTDFGFGVSRFEDFKTFYSQEATEARPFTLNQPVLDQSYPRFQEVIESALKRANQGHGGLTSEESIIEALYQIAAGKGFDGTTNGTTLDDGSSGSLQSQIGGMALNDVPRSQFGFQGKNDFVLDTASKLMYRVAKISDQPALPLNQPISGKLDNSLKATIYRVVAQKGDILALSANDWQHIDTHIDVHFHLQNGQRLMPTSTIGRIRQFSIPEDGTFALVIDREPPASLRSNIPLTEVEYNEAKDFNADYEFQFTASLNEGIAIPLPVANPIELNEIISVGPLAPGVQREFSFELDSTKLMLFRPLQGIGNWTLRSEVGSPLRWGSTSSTQVLHATQFSTIGGLNGATEDYSQPGQGGLPAGKYRIAISDQVGNQAIQFQLLDAKSNSLTLKLGQEVQGRMDAEHTSAVIRFKGRTGQEVSFESADTPSPFSAATLITPSGSEISFQGDVYPLFQKSNPIRLPADGEYLILLSASNFSGPIVPFAFKLKSKIEKELTRPHFEVSTAKWNASESLSVSDLRSHQNRIQVSAGDQVYFDGMNANARVRVDYFDADGTNLFSLKNSEFNRMLPVAKYTSDQVVAFEPIDLIASVPRNRVGGGGFRPGALPIIITATDNGSVYRVDLDPNGCAVLDVNGVGNTTVDIRKMVGESFRDVVAAGCVQHDPKFDAVYGHAHVPNGDAASVQDAVSALVDIGALVIGIGTGPTSTTGNPRTPGSLLSELSRLTGALNSSTQTILNGTIAPNEPLYVELNEADPESLKVYIQQAIASTLSYAGYDVDVAIRDYSGVSTNISPSRLAINSTESKTVELEFTGDGGSHEFYLEFLRHGTNIVLGRMPIGINYSYSYDADATDPDGDSVTYSLLDDNHGATIDSSTGQIYWLPNAVGRYSFTVQADDGRGGKTVQLWDVDANPINVGNHPPTMNPIANQNAFADRPFELQVVASDPDSDVLSFSLIENGNADSIPPGMTIDKRSGLIRWTPTVYQLGCPFNIVIAANDGRGGEVRGLFQIVATAEPNFQNRRPVISSSPPMLAVVGERYSYEFIVSDPDGDSLQFKLTNGPTAMVLDSAKRTLFWMPGATDVGQKNVSLQVSDGQGGVTYQSYALTVVTPNQSPEFLNVEPLVIEISQAWNFVPEVIDSNGDTLVFTKVAGPNGLSVSTGGLVNWTPNALGSFQFAMQADDRRGGKTIQQFSLDVLSKVSELPVISSLPVGPAIIGTIWRYEILASDPDNDPLQYQLLDPPTGMKLGTNANGKPEIQWVPASLSGNYQVHLWVTDDAQAKHGVGQKFTLPVSQRNQAPFIRSVPFDAMTGSTWTYAFNAVDPDGDALSFELVDPQPGMTIDSNGVIRWTPTLADQARFGATRTTDPVVKIRVTDGHGGEATEQVFTKVAPSVNDGEHPFVTNNATGPVFLNQKWTHQLIGIDPDGGSDKIVYSYVHLRKNGSPVSDGGAIQVSASGLVTVNATALSGLTLDDPSYEIVAMLTDDEGGQTQYKMQVRFRVKNDWPTFSNSPIGELIPGQPWSFVSTATDPDGNMVTFSKAVDSVGSVTSTGRVDFAPPSSGSESAYPLVLHANDGSFALDGSAIRRQQATTLIVTQHSDGYPRITSHPPVAVLLNDDSGYRYQVTSSDSNLSYRLSTGPQSMTVDSNGLVKWKPTQYGNFSVVLEVSNALQQTTLQRFSVSAIKPYVLNEPPEFISKPVGPAARDAEYSYQIKAFDANGDVLEYSLLESPAWMSIHPNTGKVTGIPKTAGNYPVKIRVREVKTNDHEEFESFQTFVLTVLQNAPPRITSSAPENATLAIGGSAFRYVVSATDPNSEDRSGLRYSLVHPLEGAEIAQLTGVLTYASNDIAQRGKHLLTIRVTDPQGAFDEQVFTVQALGPTNASPVFDSSPRTTLPAGILYALELKANDLDGDAITYELVNPLSGMRLENGNIFVWTPPKSLITSPSVPPVSIRFRATSARDQLTTDQQNLVIITKTVENTPPVIHSIPRKAAVAGLEYNYLPNATDSDSDFLHWRLEQGPNTIKVDAATGRMSWVPSMSDLGSQAIVLAVSDGYGGITRQSYEIAVRASNTPPRISSTPSPYARLGQVYSYSIAASDLDEDILTYSLAGDRALATAQGWSIHATTGQLTLRPVVSHGAEQSATISVQDGRGGQSEQQVKVNVFDAMVNSPPVFTNTLPDLWILGGRIQFQMIAADSAPGRTDLSFRLVQPPLGMTIDEVTGVITWRATESQIGLHQVTVRVDDGEFYSVQSKQIRVRRNASPVLEDLENVTFTGGLDWSTKANATDSDLDSIEYSLAMQSGQPLPPGLAIDSKTGTIQWDSNVVLTTTAYPLRVIASDGQGGEDSTDFTVTLTRDTIPPSVQFLSDPSILEVNRDARVFVSAKDEIGIQTGSLSLRLVGYSANNITWIQRNLVIVLDDQGRATVNSSELAMAGQASQIGYYKFEVTAKDTSNNIGYAGANNAVVLQVALDGAPPDVFIQSPIYNQTILEPIDILATIDDPYDELAEYWVTVHPADKPNQAIEVKRVVSNKEIRGGVIATVDTTLLDNGLWILNVYASDTHLNVARKSVPIQLDGNYKPGILSLVFSDLNLATPDVPLKVQRSYSSSRANKVLDFGRGWALDFGIPKVEIAYAENASPGSSGFPVLLDGTRITVTLPDGSREGFTFRPYPEHPNMLGISISWLPYFAPDKGNTSFLEVEKTPMLRIASGESAWEYVSFAGAESFHPASRAFGGFWKLYLQSGIQIHIDARVDNTAWIEDRNGNRTTITPDGIEHWSGRRIAVTRDKANDNRITSIRDEMNQTVTYSYDAIGNLIFVTDRLGQTTLLTYHLSDTMVPGKQFLLKSIIDAAGREQLLASYNAERRLESLKDVEKWTTGYSYDIRKREQAIDNGADGTGNDIKLLLDRRGNPVRSVDARGVQTLSNYDSDSNLLQQRQVIGTADGNSGVRDDLVTYYSYNEFGQPVTVTDTRGEITRYVYDDKLHQVTSLVSSTGIATSYNYDSKGNLLATTTPTGEKTLLNYLARGQVDKIRNKSGLLLIDNEYDTQGNLISVTNTDAKLNRFEYDANGRQTASISYEKDANGKPLEVRQEKDFDAADRITATRLVHRVQDASGQIVSALQWATSTVYDPKTGQVQRQTDQRGLRTDYFYDRRGKQIQMRQEVETRIAGPNSTFALSRVWTSQWTVYDVQGQVLLVTDSVPENSAQPATSPTLNASKTLYDTAGRVIGTQRLKDVVVQVADMAGAPPTSNFSNYHSLQSKILSVGMIISSTETLYDNAGRAARVRNENGLWTERYYGLAGDVVQTRTQSLNDQGNIVWIVSRSAVDELGRTILVADSFVEGTNAALAGTTGTRTFYDDLGRAFKVERRDGIKLALLDRYGAVVLDPNRSDGPYSIKILNQGVDASGNINLISRSLSFFDDQGRTIKSVTGIGPGHPGVETRFEFDERGRQVRQIGAPVMTVESPEPLRLVTEIEYDDQGRAFRTWTNIRGRDVNGVMLLDRSEARSNSQVYDHLGRAYKSIAADGSYTLVEFDKWGSVIKETDQGNNSKQNEYDSNGRLISVTLPAVPDPLDSDGDGITQLDEPRFDYGYDWSGNQTLLQDPLGRRTTFTFDALGRQISRTLPTGNIELFTYNDRGQQATHTSFEGVVTESVYDNGTTHLPASDPNYRVGTGRLAEQRFYSNSIAYAAGVANASEKWQFSYDAYGRKNKVVRSSNSSGAFIVARAEQWIYDERGQLIQESTPEGTINYAYDKVTGRKTRMWITKSSGLSPANLVDAVEDTRYNYNELGWLTEVIVVEKNDTLLSAAQQEKTMYGHDLNGRPLRVVLPDGVIETTAVNHTGAITRMRHYAPDATPYDLGDNPKRAEFVYSYDASGQRKRMVEKFWMDADQNATTADTPQQTIYDWAYDADKRLFNETIDSFDNALDRTESLTLDLFGNRMKRTVNLASTPNSVDEVFAYRYDVNDRLLDELLDRDNNGTVDRQTTYTWVGTQQASKVVVASATPVSSQVFTYNLQGRLSSVVMTTNSGPRTLVDYTYDSSSIRISATEYSDINNSGTFEPSERSKTTNYLIDHNNHTGYAQTLVETTTNAAGQGLKRIVYQFGADEIKQTVYSQSPTGNGWGEGTSLGFGHDAHGSVRVLFDAAAAIAQAYTYAAYGELIAIHNAAGQAIGGANATGLEAQALTNMLYSGESFDSRIGQQYLRARWYQPNLGRFNRLDPFAGIATNPQSFNRYAFTHGDPILHSDPTGMYEGLGGLLGSFSIGGAIVGGTAGGVISSYSGTNLLVGILTGAAAGALSGVGLVWAGSAAFGFAGGLGATLMALVANEVLLISFIEAWKSAERNQNGPPPSATQARYDNDYAMLSLDIYDGDVELSQRVKDEGWTFDGDGDTDNSGYSYHSRLYTNRRRGEMVMVYEGSTPALSHFGDWANNFQQGTGMFAEGWQFEKAKEQATSVVARAKAAGLNVHFTGHSLGGGLATAAALHTGKRATTFNASGVNKFTTSINAARRSITNYRVKGEILSTLQDSPLFGWSLPNSSSGPTYWLKARSADPITRHTADILPGMADFF